jgi:hypothetical protein
MPMIERDIRALALNAGVAEVALPDVMLSFPNDESTSFGEWFDGIKASRPHWLKQEPVAPGDELHDIKAQTAYFKEHGEAPTKAHLAQHGLKLGFVTEKPKEKGSDDAGVAASTNPWSKSFKGDAAQREARRQAIIRQSTKLAQKLAANEGVRIDGGPLLRRVV